MSSRLFALVLVMALGLAPIAREVCQLACADPASTVAHGHAHHEASEAHPHRAATTHPAAGAGCGTHLVMSRSLCRHPDAPYATLTSAVNGMMAPPALPPPSPAALRHGAGPVAARAPDPPLHPVVPISLRTPLRV